VTHRQDVRAGTHPGCWTGSSSASPSSTASGEVQARTALGRKNRAVQVAGSGPWIGGFGPSWQRGAPPRHLLAGGLLQGRHQAPRFEVAWSAARTGEVGRLRPQLRRRGLLRFGQAWTAGPQRRIPASGQKRRIRASKGVLEPEFEVVRGGIEPPTPRHSGTQFDANWPNCGELSELTVAEAVVGWTDLDGGPVRRGTPRAGFPIWEPTVGGCRLVMRKLLMVGVGPSQ